MVSLLLPPLVFLRLDFYCDLILHASTHQAFSYYDSRRRLPQSKHLYRIPPCPSDGQQSYETTHGASHLRFHNLFHGDAFHTSHNVGDPWDLTGLVPALDHRVGTPFLFLDSFW
jgi:hypothetical protein